MILRRCSQPKDQGTYLVSICVPLSSTPAADQMLLVPEPFCQSHIIVFICECVPGCFRCEITSYQGLFIVFLHSYIIACYTGCIGECVDKYLKLCISFPM